MNILIDLVPTTVNIDHKQYEINSDFRNAILFELLMQEDEIAELDKTMQALELFYPVCPKNINEAVEKMLWFYIGGKDDKNITSKKSGSVNNINRIYSFDFDDDYIYSAFLDQYGIDLQDIEYLHWWKFKAMFKSLKEDNEIVKIMGYRATDLSKIKDKEQREFYKKMKQIYELPKSRNEVEKISDIEEALLKSGNLSDIL
ncbi:Bacteriophage Gp15 protein [Clostridium collagenovorans DSM 3089]|uniref:Bacteriophage Gp15 protein n=1 Tax=Clostridium collagenovorans DSM 3089 TaxID=1121306 RepID=A0A1M5XQ54_9CLOT|nr:bacteriophage Gp15 family protein [Clostridium collagenovorans]SHI01393.1 Bacteriophage Gp15 protein [Clostridium collagenovorans DSM 3089]